MKKLCIIPARGGSKRIPRKNIKFFLGKPVVSYSIEAAKNTGLFDEIMVSTDDMEIAQIAKEIGAEVPFMRSSENARDLSTTAEVLVEVLQQYKERGQHFDYVCCIYPVAPLVSFERIMLGFERLVSENLDSVIPITSYEYPIWRSFKKNDRGVLEYQWPEFKNHRSQDLPVVYHDIGHWYWMKASLVEEQKTMIGKKTMGFEVPMLEVHDVDSEEDWILAEMKYKLKNKLL